MNAKSGFVARQVSKRFGATQALDGVTCEVQTGEIHAVLGENGAGKSTLVKIMSGHLQPDEGRLELEGEVMPALTPKVAFSAGIVVVHQELSLLPTLTVAENILINDPPLRAGLLDRRGMVARAKAHLALLAADIDPLVRIDALSQAQRQLVEIARALVHSARVILLDEPTSYLPPDERHELFGRLRLIRDQGVGIVFITHLLEEALELSDRITVLRDGRNVGTRPAADTSVTNLVELMTGRPPGTVFPRRLSTSAEERPLLTVSNVASGARLVDASFDVREGEIIGLAGLVGSGRTEVLKAVFGALPVDSGSVFLNGERVRFRTPLHAIRRGISFIPEDRQDESVFPDHSVLTNICVAAASCSVGEPLSGRFVLDGRRMVAVSEELRTKLQIKTRSVTVPIADLSGGNQQKTILARWVATRRRIMLADEATRGVSIGSKIEIYRLFRELASRGTAIVLVSSEFEELVGLCERVFIMAAGRTVDEVDPDGLEADDLLARPVEIDGERERERRANRGECRVSTDQRPPSRLSTWTHASVSLIQSSGIVVPLVVLWIVLAMTTPRFISPINLGNLSVQFAVIGALAIGTTTVIICREIDLSIGAIEGFCAVIAALTAVRLGLPWPCAVLAAVLAGAVIGGFNGFMVARVGVPSFVVTLGTLGIVGGIALVISDGQSIYGFPAAYQWIGQGSLFGVRAPIIFTGLLLIVMHIVLRHTRLGLGFYAVGGNERAAGLVGISIVRTKFIALAISGASAGLAGVLVSARLDAANPTLGALDLLDAIAAVVIGGAALTGGTGSILGTAAGVLLIVTIRNGLNLLGVNPFWQQTAIGSIIIIAAVIDHFNRTRRSTS